MQFAHSMLSLIAFLLASQASLVLAGYRQVRFHPMHFQYRKCLDVKDGVFFNGQAVQIWDCNGSAAQEWFIWDGDHFNHGTISIRAPGQNKAYCLDGSDRNPAVGTQLKIWECTLEKAGLPHGNRVFRPENSKVEYLNGGGLCMDLPGGNASNGNRVALYPCQKDQANQFWHF